MRKIIADVEKRKYLIDKVILDSFLLNLLILIAYGEQET
jgi:hypothetical protein